MELSKELGVTTIARAGGKHFLVYNGANTMIFDAKPQQKVTSILEDSANNSEDRTRCERRQNAELEV